MKTQTPTISNEEFARLASDLSAYNSLFYTLFSIGKPKLTDEIPTACITFDKKTGKQIEFLYNPKFWEETSWYEKLFITAHECLHVLLNHGKRLAIQKGDSQTVNWALDIVVNHYLVEKFGFDRSKLSIWKDLCWTDTIWPDKFVPSNKSIEYYYNRLVNDLPNSPVQTADDHSQLGNDFGSFDGQEKLKKILKKVNDQTENEDKLEAKDILEGKGDKDDKDDEDDEGDKDSSGFMAGTSIGSEVWNFDIIRKPKKSWKKLVRRSFKRLRQGSSSEGLHWVREKRRNVLLPQDLILPSDMECKPPLEKVSVWLFMDVSGSCREYIPRFWQAVQSIPRQYFDVRLFSFDYHVHEIKGTKIEGGGGTSFSTIEEKIQQLIKEEKCKYPDQVFMITDGQGNRVTPQCPEKWMWFLTERNTKAFISNKSTIYKLADFE